MNDSMISYIYEHLDDDILKEELSRIIFIIRDHYQQLLKSGTRSETGTRNTEAKLVGYEGDELNGIIRFLSRESDGQLGNSGALKLSGGGSLSLSHPLTNLLKYESDNINEYYYNFCVKSATENEGWIEFDFCERKIKIDSYTIRSNHNSPGTWYHPKSWRIVGSNDGEHWDVVDERANNSDINGPYKQHRFENNTKNDNYYRFIRYIQEDSWHPLQQGKYNIYLTCIEFFGSISSQNQA